MSLLTHPNSHRSTGVPVADGPSADVVRRAPRVATSTVRRRALGHARRGRAERAPSEPLPPRLSRLSAHVLHGAREVLLSALALGGAVCLALVVVGVLWGAHLMMFKTGSMSPTIPAGSVALVHEVSADAVAVGDVVTVERPGELPVTHRVLSNRPLGEGRAELVLKGDANPTPDPEPYVVDRVQLLTASVPGVAPLLVRAHRPSSLMVATLASTTLVTWAFWPRRVRPEEEEEEVDDATDGATHD